MREKAEFPLPDVIQCETATTHAICAGGYADVVVTYRYNNITIDEMIALAKSIKEEKTRKPF